MPYIETSLKLFKDILPASMYAFQALHLNASCLEF